MTEETRKRRPRRRRKKRKPAAPAVPAPARVDLGKAPDAPLTDEERSEVLRQLDFLRRHREVLRLKLNAHEDLLVNGTRQPEHRGRLKHLVSKLDHQAVKAALLREPLASDASRRAKFLGQAAAMNGDIAVALLYLDALVETGEAGSAFGAIVDRIDFSSLSAARLGHLLGAMEKAFPAAELPHVLFGLLRGRGFREVFDAHGGALDAQVSERFVPLRAVNDAIHRRGGLDGRDVQDGLGQLLSVGATAAHLAALPGRSREGLVRAALAGDHWRQSVIHELALELRGKASRLLWELCERLVRDGMEAEARPLMQSLGDHPEARQVLGYLDGPRAGAFALLEDASDGLVRGWSPSLFREVVLLRGRPWDPLHLPGVAAVVDTGDDWVAVEAWGTRLPDTVGNVDLETSVAIVWAGLRTLRALALAGKGLPDCSPGRFLLDTAGARARVVLADLRGVQEGTTSAGAWVRAGLAWPPFSDRGPRREVSGPLRDWAREDRSLSQWLDGLSTAIGT